MTILFKTEYALSVTMKLSHVNLSDHVRLEKASRVSIDIIKWMKFRFGLAPEFLMLL